MTEKKDYNWQRFWYPREAHIPLEGGYLYLPPQEYAHYFQDERKTIEQLVDIPCLILLGEPGIGKSSEIRKCETSLKQQQQDRYMTLHIELGGQTESTLDEELFKNQTYQSWLNDTGQLYLLLDGLDEGLLTIPVLTQILSRKFQKLPRERLFLRVTCRTADWLSSFEKTLKQLWSDKDVQAYHLAPLSRRDVLEVAGEQFLCEVASREIEPLAAKPFTLQFLLNTYHHQMEFPETLRELYYKGCYVLCKEKSDFRLESRNQGTQNAEQRLMIAARIAALMVFTNRAAISTGKDLDTTSMRDLLSVSEIWGDRECIHQIPIEVDDAALRETFNTGLFASRGSERLGWTHKSYAEFLAAFYLVQHNLALIQIKELLTQDFQGEKQVVPQLRQTIAWLATMRADLLKEIMEIEPEVLLRSDIATAEDGTRYKLVEALFQLDEIRLWQFNQQYYKFYHKLAHRGLSDQLRPFLQKDITNLATKVLSIKIAEACLLQDLQTEVCNLAFDVTQNKLVREQATCALASIGDDTTKVQLKAFLNLERDQDTDDELKGYALKALWPSHLTVEELFNALTPPKNDHFIGAYHQFIWSAPVDHLQPQNLPVALRWYEKLPSHHQPSIHAHLLFSIANAIMLRSLEHLDRAEVLDACARTILVRTQLFDNELIDSQQQPYNALPIAQDQRLQLLEKVLSLSTGDTASLTKLLDLKPRLILPQDIPWLIEYLLRVETEQQQRTAACILYFAVNRKDHDQMERVRQACGQSPILANEFASVLNSSELVTVKDVVSGKKEGVSTNNAFALTEQMGTLLTQSDDGIDIWIRCWIRAANLTYPSLDAALIDQNVLFPGWDTVTKPMQNQLLGLAKRYIRECDPKSHEWIETQQAPLSIWILYRTLQLLVRQGETEHLSALPSGQWQKLAPVVLLLSQPGDRSTDDELMKTAYEKVADTVIQNTLILVDRVGMHSTDITIVDKISRYWDKTIEKAFLNKVQEASLHLNGLFCILRVLLIHHVEGAIAFVHSLLTTDVSNEEQCERVVFATCALLLYADHLNWSLVRSTIDQNETCAKKLLWKLAHITPIPPQLSVDEIAELYIRLMKHYPTNQYPLSLETSFVSTVDSTALWRQTLISFLKEQGTPQACAAIERIMSEAPDAEQFGLKWILREAQQLTRRQTWEPFAPRDILKMVQDSRLRLVQNGNHLLDVVMESLRHLEKILCCQETPAWRDVWDLMPFIACPHCETEIKRSEYEKDKKCPQCQNTIKKAPKTYRPVTENEFSDYIKRHLTSDLKKQHIIANREVVISNKDRTDIYIEAWIDTNHREANDKVSVIIEVKGCWHQAWQSAMKKQLVEQYLKKYSCRHGIYLVGWFMCPLWNKSDSRYQATPKEKSIVQVRDQLEKQAESLSQQGIHVKAMVMNATIP
jgi:hypothetical protein